MKKYLFILPLSYICTKSYGQQQLKVSEIKSNNLVSTLCSVDTVIFKNNNTFSLILYKISNASGSAHMPETDEVSNRFLIAVTNGDEVPEQHLFNIGDFYDPKIIKWEKLKDKYRLYIDYGGTFKGRRKITLNISLNAVVVVNK